MRIGVLTAGGDAPGLNAAIRAIGEMAIRDGHEVMGVANGWAGLAADFAGAPLSADSLRGVIAQGGTLLGTARFDLDRPAGGRDRVLQAIDEHLDALVAIGGDGTQRISKWLADRGAPVVGVPKTLDNDLCDTEYCIGFDSAVSTVAEALDRLHTTAASHHRVMVLETMGRSTGWVATMGGLAGGADLIVIPEFPVTMDQIMAHLERRVAAGLAFSIVVVAEGVPLESLGGHDPRDATTDGVGRVQYSSHSVGHFVARGVHRLTGFETRSTVLGHLQRGGSPSAYDRIWATRVGSAAYDAVLDGDWGAIPIVRSARVERARIDQVISRVNTVPRELYELCTHFF